MKLKVSAFVMALALSAAFSALPLPLQCQTLFQNNNQACEADPVLCATGGCVFPDANSIACRHILPGGTFRGADFNGDGFTDCVAARENNFQAATPEPQASVLINNGALAVSCSPGPGAQFGSALDYTLSGLGTSNTVANVVVGDLNGGNADFAVPNLLSATQNVAQALNPGTGFGPGGSTLATTNVGWAVNTQFGFNEFFGQRTTALFDCNGDGTLEAVIAVEQQSPSPSDFFINILMNAGAGLQSTLAGDSFDTNVATNFSGDAVLTVNDFNGDDRPDVALAIFTDSDGTPVTQAATVCLNDGACNFTCPATPTIDLVDQHPGQDPVPVSIESGDFDGDGNGDLVVSEPGLSASDPVPTPEPEGLQYYFGNGDGTFTRNLFVPYDLSSLSLQVAVLTTGCFNNDNVVDVAVTSQDSESPLNNLGIFLSDGSGGIRTPFPLFAAGGMEAMRSVESGDFDNAGGDDLIVLARNPSSNNDQAAFVFLNSLETLSAVAGADQTGSLNQDIAVAGGLCAVSPDDAADPARFAVSWSVTAAPPGAAPSLGGADTLTPTFRGDVPGAYSLTLQCRTRCTSVASDTKTITLAGIPPTPVPTPMPPPALQTQGGCLARLTPASEGEGVGFWLGLALLSWIPWGLLRRGRAI